MKKIGLILEGGGTRGVFTAGVLDYLMEQELWFPYVCGVSAGACNAVDYISRQPGRTKKCLIVTEKEHKYLSMKNFIKYRSLFDMDMLFRRYPDEIHPFDYETYQNSPIKCELVVTNCITGKAEYLDDRKNRRRLMDICRASSSMPVVSPMVPIDGIPYLDGGLADSIPLLRAQELGFEKNIVILTRGKGYRKKHSSKADHIYHSLFKKYPALTETMCSRPEVYNETLDYVEQEELKGTIFVIRPKQPAVSRTEKDIDRLEAFFQHGYDYAGEHFSQLKAFIDN